MNWDIMEKDRNIIFIVSASSLIAFLLFALNDLRFAICMSVLMAVLTFIFILGFFGVEERGIEKGSERRIFREMERIQKGERFSLKDVLLFSDRLTAYISIKVGMKNVAIVITLIYFFIITIVVLFIAYLLHTMAGKGDFLSDMPAILPRILVYAAVFCFFTYLEWSRRMKREMELMKES